MATTSHDICGRGAASNPQNRFETTALDDVDPEFLEMIHRDDDVPSLRGGALNQSAFGVRMRGVGVYADQIAMLFRLGCRKAAEFMQ